jgi:hypothetical protein
MSAAQKAFALVANHEQKLVLGYPTDDVNEVAATGSGTLPTLHDVAITSVDPGV